MSRNPKLEAIFEARYAWENAIAPERAACLTRYHALLDEALGKSGATAIDRNKLEDALMEAYREFRRAKRLEERAKLSRLR